MKAPKLRLMEIGTSSLFQGEDQPFNLAGETTMDGERICSERSKAEQTKAEAAKLAAKRQIEFDL